MKKTSPSLSTTIDPSAEPVPEVKTVVLLHGLARRSGSMKPMQRFLQKQGYRVFNLDYPSRKRNVRELSQLVCRSIEESVSEGEGFHVVTHSMGGIILRQIVADTSLPGLRRCVMLAPPNRGSQIVDRLRDLSIYRWLNGPAGQELGTGPEGVAARLGAVPFDLGVIAGNRSVNLLLSLFLPGPNDGKVAVSHAGAEGQRDFIVLPTTHPFIMRNREVQANTLAFLREGAFLGQA